MELLWQIQEDVRHDRNGRLHVVPLNDLFRHTASKKCTCGPIKREPYLYTHPSMDGREFFEEDYTGPPMPKEPGHTK